MAIQRVQVFWCQLDAGPVILKEAMLYLLYRRRPERVECHRHDQVRGGREIAQLPDQFSHWREKRVWEERITVPYSKRLVPQAVIGDHVGRQSEEPIARIESLEQSGMRSEHRGVSRRRVQRIKLKHVQGVIDGALKRSEPNQSQ